MTDRQELHKLIVERFGGCWHEPDISVWDEEEQKFQTLHWRCGRCKKEFYSNPDLDTYEGFGLVWGWMRRDKKRWERFCIWLYDNRKLHGLIEGDGLFSLIDNPSKFIDAVGEFLKQEGER